MLTSMFSSSSFPLSLPTEKYGQQSWEDKVVPSGVSLSVFLIAY